MRHGPRFGAADRAAAARRGGICAGRGLAAAAADFAALGMDNAAAVYANHPPLAQALGPHLRYIVTGSTLSPRKRSLLGLRAVWLARSPYLWTHLAAVARENR